jgi:hypothetical protein
MISTFPKYFRADANHVAAFPDCPPIGIAHAHGKRFQKLFFYTLPNQSKNNYLLLLTFF